MPVYITSGVSFELDDSPEFLWAAYDYSQVPLAKKVVAPGDSYSASLSKERLVEHASHIKSAFLVDELGRRFKTDEAETRKAFKDV